MSLGGFADDEWEVRVVYAVVAQPLIGIGQSVPIQTSQRSYLDNS